MSQEIINIGAAANDGTGDPLRTAFDKVNNNFTQLYTTLSASGPDGSIQFKNTNTLYSTLYVGDTYLIAGAPGRVYYSPDGAVWNQANTGTEEAIYSLAYDGIDTIIAVGANGTILRSNDGGVTWASSTSGVTENLYGAVGFNGSLAVVGANGTILTSHVGGEGYTQIPTVTIAAPANAGGITATATATIANGRVSGFTITEPGLGYNTAPTVTIANPTVAGTTATATATVSGGIVTAVDLTSGVTWNEPVTGITATLTGITHGNLTISSNVTPIYVATGVTGTIVTSTDLVTWSSVNTGSVQDLYSAVIDPRISKLIVVGESGTVLTTFNTSLWTTEDSNVSTILTSIAYGVVNTVTNLIAVGDAGTVIRSNNGGVNWYSAASNTTGNALLGVTFVSNTANITSSSFIAVGSNATVIESNALALANAWSLQSVGSALQGDGNLLYFPGTQTLSANANIVPGTDSAFSLGSPNLKFTDLYLAGNSLYLGTTLITSNANNSITFAQASNTANLTDLIGNSITVEGAAVTGNINVGDYVLANNVTTGNLVAANANFNTLTVSNIQLNGNITADYYFGNGAFLTGISGNGGSFPAGNSGAVQINYLGNFSNQGGTPNDTYSTFQFDGNGMPTIDGTNAYQQRVNYSPYLQVLSPRVESEDFGIVAGPGITIVGYDDNYNTPRSAYFSVQNRSNVTQQWDFGILGNGDNNYSISDRTNGNIWTFGTDGRLTFPGTARIDTADDNFEVQAAENVNFEANATVNIYTDASGNAYQWQFGDDGNLTLPANTFAVNYANGAPVTLGAAALGNVTFDDQIVIGTGSDDGSGGLYLATGPTGAANLQYLQVRGGDNVAHIHLDTGNNAYYDQYFGDDNKYLKLSAGITGNVVIGTDDDTGNLYTWTFDNTGNLTLPGNLIIAGNISVFGTNAALIAPTDDKPLIALSSGANGSVSSLWAEDIGNVGTSNIAAVYVNPTSGSKIVRIAVGQNGGNTGPNLWDFGTDGRLTFPGTPRIDTDANNFEVQAAESINFEANAVVNIYTDSGNNAFQWQFGDDGTTTFPANTLKTINGANAVTPGTAGTAGAPLTISAGTGGIAATSLNAGDGGALTIKAGDAGSDIGNPSWGAIGGTLVLRGGNSTQPYAGSNVEIRSGNSASIPGVISLYTGTNQWQFGNDGNLTVPGSFINDTSIVLSAPAVFNICTISTAGSGYNTGSSLKATTGGSGTGMTVGIGYGLSNQLTNVTVVDPGTGYVNGDVITVSGGTGGTFVITKYNQLANQANNNTIQTDFTFANNTVTLPIYGEIATNASMTLTTNLANTGNTNSWTFDTNGNLTLPDTTSVIANVSITLEANDTGNITGLNVIGDSHANLYAHGNVTIVSDSSNTTATWTFDNTGNATFPANGSTALHNITGNGLALFGQVHIGGNLNFAEDANLIIVEDKDGFADIIAQNKNSGGNASMNIVLINDDPGNVYMAVGVNSSNFTPLYNTLFEIPAAGYVSHTLDQIIGPQSSESANSRIFLTYNSGAAAIEINQFGAIGWGASYNGNLTEGNFGNVGQILTSAGENSAPTWNNLSGIANGTSNVNIATANGNVNISAVGNANVFVVTGTGVNVTGNITAIAATATTSGTAASVGYIGMPQQSKATSYTTVIGDAGKHVYVTATATITIDSNANVAYPIGTSIMFIANTGATATIAINSDTLTLVGTGTTGSRTLAPFGMATAVKVTNTIWFISGNGLT